MSLPEIKVEIKFDTTTLTQYAFVLDNLTQGQLNNTGFLLGGEIFIDVSQYLKSFSTQRGKSRLLDRYEAGTASIEFDNTERVFDPLFTDSPFYGAITPRLEIKVFADEIVQYTGVVMDWNIEYDQSGYSTAIAVCSDKFTILAQATTDIFFPDVQLSGERITTILDLPEVSFIEAERSIDQGVTVLSGETISADVVVLDYLQQVEVTEQGSLFIGKNGDLTFQQRNTGVIFDTLFSDDGSGIPFTDIGNVFGTELLFNRIQITPSGLSTVTRTDNLSVEAYGTSAYNQTTLHEFIEDAETLATALLNKYSKPQYRFERIVVNLNNLTAQQVEEILDLELNSGISIKFTPSGIGDPIEQAARIIGISHSRNVSEHILEFQLESVLNLPLVLDNEELGVLNQAQLGF